MKGKITTIQRMSINDGPGIRSTIFMKGCNLRCKWCHNPETFSTEDELERIETKCIHCGKCASVCKSGALTINANGLHFNKKKCTECFKCIDQCFPEALQKIGKDYTPEELFQEIMQDFTFFRNSGGGITISGGEPMLQSDFVKATLKLFHENNIHTGIETNMSIPWVKYKGIMPFTDLFMCDIKIIDNEKHKKWTGAGNSRILKNILNLDKTGKPYYIRTPVIPGFNHSLEEIRQIVDFVGDLKNIKKYELLPFHSLAELKYKNLGIPNPFKGVKSLSQKDLKIYEPILTSII